MKILKFSEKSKKSLDFSTKHALISILEKMVNYAENFHLFISANGANKLLTATWDESITLD